MRLAAIIRHLNPKALASFGAAQAMQLLLPLLALPWLGRVLGPEAFGLLMYMSVLPPIIFLFMDWGILPGAARAAALVRSNPGAMASLVGSVAAGKTILLAACLLGATLALPVIPHAAAYPGAYYLAVFLGIARGLNPLWFFQGAGEKIKNFALLDVLSSAAALALIFIFIRAPEQWALYLLFCAFCKGAAYLWINWKIWHGFSPQFSLRQGFRLLGETKTLFSSSIFTMIYNSGAQLLLGYYLTAPDMGIIVAVNKMQRAMASMVNPFTQTIFPEICILRQLRPARARSILRASLLAMFLLMLAGAVCVFWLAAPILKIALGNAYAAGAPVLKVMIFAAPLMACDYVLGMQILVPFGQEKAQVAAQAVVAAASLAAIPLLAPALGIMAGAWLPLAVEWGLAAAYLLAIRARCPQALWTQEKEIRHD